MWQLYLKYYKCAAKVTIMLQLMYDVYTCNPTMCS